MIPDLEASFSLLRECTVPVHIVNHSVMVARASLVLGEAVSAAGRQQDFALLAASGVLHDIAKFATLETGEDHARAGADWLEARGLKAVARVVGQHVRLELNLHKPVDEVELVFYADKRVQHEKIVTLEQRFIDLQCRYGSSSASLSSLEEMKTMTTALEDKIFRCLSWPPDELEARVMTAEKSFSDRVARYFRQLSALYEKYIDNRTDI